MQDYVVWFFITFGMVALEMMTGTFYMLMLSIAMAGGGLTALSGFGITTQCSVAAIIGVSGTLALQRWRASREKTAPAFPNPDIGQSVRVEQWNDDGTARVYYRGTYWNAQTESTDTPKQSCLYISDIRGSTLIVSSKKPGAS